MYDVVLYDSNIKPHDKFLYYDHMDRILRCMFEVLVVREGDVSMTIRSKTYDGWYRDEFWKYKSDFKNIYRIKELF